MNIAEILKFAPEELMLYSSLCGYCYLNKVTEDKIIVKNNNDVKYEFLQDGSISDEGECLLFPDKRNRDWSNWPLSLAQTGTCLAGINVNYVFLYNQSGKYSTSFIAGMYNNGELSQDINQSGVAMDGNAVVRYASPKEKEALLYKLECKGYTYDEENRVVIKIKVNNKIKDNIEETNKQEVDNTFEFPVVGIDDLGNTLRVFDKVLVRDENYRNWKPKIIQQINENQEHKYECLDSIWKQCVIFNNNTIKLFNNSINIDEL